MSEKRLESVDYAARRLNITTQRVYELAREGLLPDGVVIRLGRQMRVDPERLETFIEQGGKALPGGWRKAPASEQPGQGWS